MTPILVTKIISGGQTGADRGGLDAAIDLGLERGGWAPHGWRSEDGKIPERYRVGMQEHSSRGYLVRTRQNVVDSDATLVLSLGSLRPNSGSAQTVDLARMLNKPCMHVAIQSRGVADIRLWLHSLNGTVRVLNIAGPRESREPGVQMAVRAALVQLLRGGV